MREMFIEIGQEFSVVEVEHVRATVGHNIDNSWEEIMQSKVMAMALMERLKLRQVADGNHGRGGAVAFPCYRGGFVRKVMDGVLANIDTLGKDIKSGDGGSECVLAIRNVS
jgi:hypothetical protein